MASHLHERETLVTIYCLGYWIDTLGWIGFMDANDYVSIRRLKTGSWDRYLSFGAEGFSQLTKASVCIGTGLAMVMRYE